MASVLKRFAQLALTGLAVIASATGARADLILAFSQLGTSNTIVATNPTPGQTEIRATDVAVIVTAIDPSAGLALPFQAYLNLLANSVSTATLVGTDIRQEFVGTFAITSGLGGTGMNYLSGNFVDAAFGSGTGLSMAVSDAAPGEVVNFSSDVITTLLSPRAMALALTNVTPMLAITDGTIAAFTSGISGNFSAAPVPEPASIATACGGLLMLGGSAWLRRRRGC